MVRPVMVGVGAMAVQRLAELARARRHEAALRERGAREHGAGHYPLIVALHVGWLAGTALEGWSSRGVRWRPAAMLVGAQGLRQWAITSLGEQWTTRVLVDPTATPVTSGPYRWLRHPNYVAVVVEIAAFPLTFGARRVAVAFSVANGLLLRHRIEVEDRARGSPPPVTGRATGRRRRGREGEPTVQSSR